MSPTTRLLVMNALADASDPIRKPGLRAPRTRRMGRFTVHCELIESSWEILLTLMAKVVVVRCEQLYDRDCFEYTALSELFEEVPMGYLPPMYQIIFTREGDKLTVRAEKL